MIRHLLKLVWRRKRANALLIIEIFFSFLVFFAVVTFGTSAVMHYKKPLNFDWHDVLVLNVGIPFAHDVPGEERHGDSPADLASLDRLMREIAAMPQVVAIGGSRTPPYSLSTMAGSFGVGGKRVRMTFDEVTDGYPAVMNIPIVRGRWFNAEDDVATFQPVVIDSDLAKALFGDEDPIGKRFDPEGGRDLRVVGVTTPFRKDGEFTGDNINMVFRRVSPRLPNASMPRDILIRVRPGTPASFEEAISRRTHEIFPNYDQRVRRMEAMRTFALRLYLIPIAVGTVIATFLIGMVALGLSGVLWQNVTRRTREIGLRRALGATGNEVNRQILLEVALLSTLALIVGVIVVAQLPLLGIFQLVSPASFSVGLAGALATIYGLTLLCGVYPSWLAGRVQPAQALHYE
ncbi:MAG: putative transport system permease protein [Thermoanaerobaculia bacterium]|nr:putative transport system permease protein [Thermoanaerobaculia bacterium]